MTDTTERWNVHTGDSLAWMADLPAGIASAIVTDPPYSSGGAFRSDRQTATSAKYLSTGSANLETGRLPDFHGDNRTERGLLLWCALWMAEAWRIAEDGGAIAVFCDWRSLPTMSDALQAGGWSWRGVGVWIKPPGKSRPVSGGLWNDTEFVLWGSKGHRAAGECLPGTWTMAAPASTSRLHITEKPLPLVEDLTRLAPPDGLVVDPFMGSGTTGVAAIQQRRRFAGAELAAPYAELATERIAQAVATGADTYGSTGPTLFADHD